jgi:hypothetical protein
MKTVEKQPQNGTFWVVSSLSIWFSIIIVNLLYMQYLDDFRGSSGLGSYPHSIEAAVVTVIDLSLAPFGLGMMVIHGIKSHYSEKPSWSTLHGGIAASGLVLVILGIVSFCIIMSDLSNLA